MRLRRTGSSAPGSDRPLQSFARNGSCVSAFSDVKRQAGFSSYLFVTNVVIMPTSVSAVSPGRLGRTRSTTRGSDRLFNHSPETARVSAPLVT